MPYMNIFQSERKYYVVQLVALAVYLESSKDENVRKKNRVYERWEIGGRQGILSGYLRVLGERN